jgi:hypothetical protein
MAAHDLAGIAFREGRVLDLATFDAVDNQRTVPVAEYVRNFLFARPEVLAALGA